MVESIINKFCASNDLKLIKIDRLNIYGEKDKNINGSFGGQVNDDIKQSY